MDNSNPSNIDVTISKTGRVEVKRGNAVVMSGRPKSMQEFSDRLKAIGMWIRPYDTRADDGRMIVEEIPQELVEFLPDVGGRPCAGGGKAQFEDLEEMLRIDFVRGYSDRPNFHRFSLDGGDLMAEFEGGTESEIVGTLTRPGLVNLPKWEKPVHESQ